MKVAYAPLFLRQLKKMPKDLKEEVKEKIDLFRKNPSHPFLKVHTLGGKLKNQLSFSVNYRYRVIFEYISKDEVILLAVGSHDVYKR